MLVGVTVEDNVDFSTCTIGGISATLAGNVRNTAGTPDNVAAFFYANVPTGTTANIVVVVSGSISQTGRLTAWAVFGSNTPHSDVNTNTGAGVSITLTGVTITNGGMGFWVFNNATTSTAITWTNATERDDTSVGNYRHGSADSSTAGTATITADGATANQCISGISFTSWAELSSYWQRDGFEVPHLRSFETIGT